MEDPVRPGPKERIAYIAEVGRIRGNVHLTVMALYTTTVPWEPDARLPLGVVPVDHGTAQAMNQKGFVLDARKVAFVPVTKAFFPRLESQEKGIVHMASSRFQNHVLNTLAKLAKRPDLVVGLGPDAPG
ncbi:hypothetical protein [uncultured Rhodospira sp.]|uniref:hypothetical protein n=1 Tax=uncultured Rhodospira sp. TaxID=1936189 RepID=UPI0026320078|nr:hypothetical protein [uncultured Rhodospira sp.]